MAYNYLNLPRTVNSTDNSQTISYTYTATGEKLRRQSNQPGAGISDYDNGIVYDNGTVYAQTEEGRVLNLNGTINYEYNVADHLGNTRVTFDTSPGYARPVQTNDYFPFGLAHSGNAPASPPNNYLYNKKELQPETNQYDYGARFYDPIIARWTSVDPLAELARRWSPDGYANNNPIKNVDVDGMWTATAGGYTTSDADEIAEYIGAIQTPNGGKQDDKKKKEAQEKKAQEEKHKRRQEQRAFDKALVKHVQGFANFILLLQGHMELLKGFGSEGFGAESATVADEVEAVTGSLSIDAGTFSESEINAGIYLKELGNDVILRTPTGTRAGGATSDLLVNGVNYDVYTPTTKNVNNIIGAIAKKNSQTVGVIVDLSKTNVTASQLTNVLQRVQGAGATNIKHIIIMPK